MPAAWWMSVSLGAMTPMANLELTVATPHVAPFRPTRELPVPVLKGRGVYIADFLDAQGNPIIQAIGKTGRVVSWLPWLPDLSLEQLVAELWRYLDMQDPPRPRLLT